MQTSLPSSPTSPGASPQMKQECAHSADCLKMIQLILDGEATEDQVKSFYQVNLESCRPCIEMYHLEKEIKDLLHGKMEKKCCPGDIIESIKAKIVSFS